MTFQFQTTELNAHYDAVYDATERRWREICALDKANHIVALLGERASQVGSVLEVGCGTGDVVARLSKLGLGKTFVGVDVIDPGMNNDHVRDQDNLSFVRQTGPHLPFEDGSFDLVFASHVLEHVEDERAFLKEIARVSRRYMYLEVPCELHARTRYSDLQASLDIGHINAYTPESFSLTLATSGLDVLDLRCFDHSVAVHAFHTSTLKGYLKRALRSTLLSVSENLAPKVFTYHCGALCTPPKRDVEGTIRHD
ncbi:SAM-dependent methyltransferase [Methylobacterium variabile]|uniref:SAM-dependent methyltransferase n=1 Tax=Methylobacterium variabile TaxID=298794 RepID=A0A0J6RXR9_9HYPH|nr:class I SAM-dependent methyltransferase [Methylobacterium variabile]KMO27630.1 SAM-dependent methyltransferase [Methylobacterium variabile]